MGAGFFLQESLFDDGEPQPDGSFAGLRRIELDAHSWVDHAPGWLAGADAVFTELLATGRFGQRTVRMYDRTVPEPRLTAGWSPELDDETPESLRGISAALSCRYAVLFDRIWVNLYRDGRDSVAWHGDRNRHTHRNPLVATVSLGARRRFLLRPRGASRAAHSLRLGSGDLIVMGGACQHDWEHTVPKESDRGGAAPGARMSVTLRHTMHLGNPAAAATEPLPVHWTP